MSLQLSTYLIVKKVKQKCLQLSSESLLRDVTWSQCHTGCFEVARRSFFVRHQCYHNIHCSYIVPLYLRATATSRGNVTGPVRITFSSIIMRSQNRKTTHLLLSAGRAAIDRYLLAAFRLTAANPPHGRTDRRTGRQTDGQTDGRSTVT